jgi:hypothetical protein
VLVHCWEHEVLEEARGEFVAVQVRPTQIFLLIYSYTIQHSH